jgi:hypothetical protein
LQKAAPAENTAGVRAITGKILMAEFDKAAELIEELLREH